MPIVVSDNSPLNLLIRLRQENVLPALFGSVVIPQEVVGEMAHPKAPGIVRDFIADIPAWLSVRSPREPKEFPTLDPGESAAIALALEMNSPLMIDERAGRDVARSHGLLVIGAVGVLERAADIGLVADLAAVYAEVRVLRFHIDESILAASLARHLQKSPPPK